MWKIFKGTLFFMFLTFLASVFAEPVKRNSGNFSFRHNDFAGELDEVDGNKYWLDFNYVYYYRKPFVDKEGKFDLALRYNDANYTMFSVKEAQMTHLGSDWELSYGRQKIDWVEVDKVWGLGKINNRVNFDFFRPGQEGLLGVRFKKQVSDLFMFDVFASYLYVPELNPPLNIDSSKGRISSKSPWAQLPDKTADIGGTSVSLFYDVNKPEVSEVLFNESYGLNLKFSPKEDLHFTAFYMRKPENGLSNTATVDYDPKTDVDVAFVRVQPRIFYHTLYGSQISYEPSSSWKFYVSYYTSIPGDKPDDDIDIILNDIGIGMTIEKFQEEYVGAGFHYSGTSLEAGLSLLSRVSDFEKNSLLTQTPRWSQAINAYLNYQLTEYWSFFLDLKYDTLTYDRLYSFTLNWVPHYRWNLRLGADIIGTPDVGEGYWVVFRDNDSIFAEAQYFF